jgi:alpha-galactosidase
MSDRNASGNSVGVWRSLRGLLFLAVVESIENGVARTPPMGWSSRDNLGCKVTAQAMKEAGDALVDLGLARLGYTYLVSTTPPLLKQVIISCATVLCPEYR